MSFSILPFKLLEDSKKKINSAIKKLELVINSNNSTPFPPVPDDIIEIVFKKFKTQIKKKEDLLTSKDIRILVFNLNYRISNQTSIFQNEKDLSYFLNLTNETWKDSFISGFLDCLMHNWEGSNKSSLELIYNFISDKIVKYSGDRKQLKNLKNNWKYFNLKNGNLILGNDISLLQKSIFTCPDFLALSESSFTKMYFSKTILAYYEKERNNIDNIIDDVISALEKHSNQTTYKRVISKIIKQANDTQNLSLQEKIKKAAFTFIGDPENKTAWAEFNNASREERSDLEEARTILNEWMTRQFIEIFFRICVNNDRRRKIFWLSHINIISSFKFFGPTQIKDKLLGIPQVADFVESRFSEVNSNANISAFVLYIRDYTIIEFSNLGYACYAYKNNNGNRPNLQKKLDSVDQLRNGQFQFAVSTQINNFLCYAEGRLRHSDQGNMTWEEIFNIWLNEIVL